MPPGRVTIQLDDVTNSCFVVMPFDALYEAQYERVIKPAIDAAGLTCVRGDEIYARQTIIEDIWLSIRRARLVVAELSDRNPNVMYEIGLAHAIGKPIILLTRSEDDVPFDLRALRRIRYDTNNPSWGSDLCLELTQVIRLAMDNPSLAVHLGGVEVDIKLPEPPTEAIAPKDPPHATIDLSGVWYTTWLSVKRSREHKAILAIPADHGPSFTASMTVTYERLGRQTIVQETLKGAFRGDSLSLVGVTYTYIEQGSSSLYGLDTFELDVSKDRRTLNGAVILRHGTREVSFARVQNVSPAGEG